MASEMPYKDEPVADPYPGLAPQESDPTPSGLEVDHPTGPPPDQPSIIPPHDEAKKLTE